MQDFEEEIELLVLEGGQTYLEAIACYAERHNIDNATIVAILKTSKPIMVKLKSQCKQLSLLQTDRAKDRSLQSII